MDDPNSEEYERTAREDLWKTFNADYETPEEIEHALHAWTFRFKKLLAPVTTQLIKDVIEESTRKDRDIDTQREVAELLYDLLSRTAGLSVEDVYPEAVAIWEERHPGEVVPFGPGDYFRIREG